MNAGSLFAGIGGFDLGLERAGISTVWQVEQNPYRRAVLARHFPRAERFGDIRECGAHNLAPVDHICGGFPCQDLSLAGRGAGLAGERSGLWSEMLRVVLELRPRYVVVENVPALLARGLGTVVGDLAEGGYDAEWDCIPAAAFGAPHKRDRIWLVAYPGSVELRDEPGRSGGQGGPGASVARDDGAQEPLADSDGCGRGAGQRDLRAGQPDAAGSGEVMADPDGEGPQGHRGPLQGAGEGAPPASRPTDRTGEGGDVADADEGGRTWRPGDFGAGRRGESANGGVRYTGGWPPEPDVGRVAYGVPSRVDRLSALGDSLVPPIAEWLGLRILSYEQEG